MLLNLIKLFCKKKVVLLEICDVCDILCVIIIMVYFFFNVNSMFLILLLEIGFKVLVGLFNKIIFGFIVKIWVI